MKKIFALFLIALLSIVFISCAQTNDELANNFEKQNEEKYDMLEFESGSHFDVNWEEITLTYTKPVVSDKETAVKIAEAIFSGMEKDEIEKNYVPQYIFFDEQNEIWIVSFWENNDVIIGGSINIAIQKNDGKVLKIWYDE